MTISYQNDIFFIYINLINFSLHKRKVNPRNITSNLVLKDHVQVGAYTLAVFKNYFLYCVTVFTTKKENFRDILYQLSIYFLVHVN